MNVFILLLILSFSNQTLGDQGQTIPMDVAKIACSRIHSKLTDEDLMSCIKRLQGLDFSLPKLENQENEFLSSLLRVFSLR